MLGRSFSGTVSFPEVLTISPMTCLSLIVSQAQSPHPLLEFLRVDTCSHRLPNSLKIDTLISFVDSHIEMDLHRLLEPVVP